MSDASPVPVDNPVTVAALPVPARAAAPTTALVRPAAALGDIQAAFSEYVAVCDSLLDPSDFQRIGDREFRKKSAWRKLAVAFGVSVHYLDRGYTRDDEGRIVRAEVVAQAVAPNGRLMDGLGACDIKEKCCDPDECPKRGKHKHCRKGCSGRIHFSNPEHDLPATAATRATNRACADLFGMGEVSAEEVAGDVGDGGRDPEVVYRTLGWPGRAEHDRFRDRLVVTLRAGDPKAQQQFRKWREGAGIDFNLPFSRPQATVIDQQLAALKMAVPTDDDEALPFNDEGDG